MRENMKKWNSETLRKEPLVEIGEFFNNRAEIYEQVHTQNIGGGIESKNIISSFLRDNTESIIDFGIGTGLELAKIFERFPEIKVTGIDVAENMLQKVKDNYPDKNIELFCESYLDYNFGISCYDAALSVMTMHHYDHKTKTDLYRRICFCLKENGIYIECDYMLHENDYENAQEMEDFYFSEYKLLKEKQGITDDRQYHYDTPCTVSNQIKMLKEAGFTEVNEVWHTGNAVILVAERTKK
jgi:tRNA (cmo5U34)-methyltransferase